MARAVTAPVPATRVAHPSQSLLGSQSRPGAGVLVHASSCEQAPPQSQKDRATYSLAELARYGLPPRTPGESFSRWASIVRGAGRRVCDYTASNDRWGLTQNWNWAGNVADESSSGQNYTETDMDYFVSCIIGTPPTQDSAIMGAWIGLGGDPGQNLVQTGTTASQEIDPYDGKWVNLYQTFVENTADPVHPGAKYFFAVSCGQHIYVKVWGGNCMYLQRIDDGTNTGNQCYGPAADSTSAEAIVERNGNYVNFVNFGYITFKGVGITDNGSYLAMNQVPHHYEQPYDCLPPLPNDPPCTKYASTPLATVGPIQSDPNDWPYDKYAVNWVQYT